MSFDVLKLIKEERGDRHDYQELDVSDEGETIFVETLNRLDPSGIVSMGQGGFFGDVNLELYAYRAPVSWWRQSGGQRIDSSFARDEAELRKELDGKEPQSKIGHYYCNRIYQRGLTWANGERPAVFFHIPLFGNRKTHQTQVLATVDHLERRLR